MRGVKFRFMHLLEGLVLDFFSTELRLCIEVDGGIHERQIEYDAERTRVLTTLGIAVIRVRNHEVLGDLPGVLAKIEAAVLARPILVRR